jgi:hypothetical protein
MELIDDNPSLRPLLDERIRKAYQQGVLLAVKETDIDERKFPQSCTYTQEQILDLGFYPGD